MTVKQDKTGYSKPRQTPHRVAAQGNPIGGNILKIRLESEIHSLPLLGIPQKHEANSRDTYTEYLVQTHVGFMITASGSLCLHCPGVLHPL